MNQQSIVAFDINAFAYSNMVENEAGINGKMLQNEKDAQSIISMAYENTCCDRNTFNVLF